MPLNINLDPALLAGFIEVFALMVLKTILAVWLAVKKGEFQLIEVPRFLYSNVLPYGGGLLSIGLVSTIHPTIYAGYFVIVATLNKKYGEECWDLGKELFGTEIPEIPVE